MVALISPRTACRYLRDITDPQCHFGTVDGNKLANLMDLACYLKSCPPDSFRYHVSKTHNHFSNWVQNIVLDRDLARQMSLVLEKNPMKIIVAKRINELVYNATRKLSGPEKATVIFEDAYLPNEHFLTNDGRTIRNLYELNEFLCAADENIVSYHAKPIKHDIAEWVGDVLLDDELSDNLFGVSDLEELRSHVADRICQLESFRHPKLRRSQQNSHHLHKHKSLIGAGKK